MPRGKSVSRALPYRLGQGLSKADHDPVRTRQGASLVTFWPASLVKTKPEAPDLPSELTNACASAAVLNGPVSTRLVARSGVHQPDLPLNAAGALATAVFQALGSESTFAPPATCTQTRLGSALAGSGFLGSGFFGSGFFALGSSLAASALPLAVTGFAVLASGLGGSTFGTSGLDFATGFGAGRTGSGTEAAGAGCETGSDAASAGRVTASRSSA